MIAIDNVRVRSTLNSEFAIAIFMLSRCRPFCPTSDGRAFGRYGVNQWNGAPRTQNVVHECADMISTTKQTPSIISHHALQNASQQKWRESVDTFAFIQDAQSNSRSMLFVAPNKAPFSARLSIDAPPSISAHGTIASSASTALRYWSVVFMDLYRTLHTRTSVPLGALANWTSIIYMFTIHYILTCWPVLFFRQTTCRRFFASAATNWCSSGRSSDLHLARNGRPRPHVRVMD